ISTGVHDPLYARCLYLEDDGGNSVAIVCLDLILGGFEACDSLRAEIREKAGAENAVINFSHSHSSAALGPRGRSKVSNDADSKWNDATLDSILAIVRQAKQRAEPVSLRAGRVASHVGFNRRLVDKDSGHVYMGVNRNGPAVPWVNVLIADSKKTGKPMSVLFETAGHPVIVPHTTRKTSADFPGAAVDRIREVLGDDVIAMFGQGCGGNINGFPLRSSYENAIKRGRNLGDSVLKAIKNGKPIESASLRVKMARTSLPSRPLPTAEAWEKMAEQSKDNPGRMNQLKKIKELMDADRQPPARRLDVYAVTIGKDWCLTTMPHEMFCQYELWIDKHAPFPHTMTFAYTNGYEGYIAVDAAWQLGAKGGYEAASLPNWGGQVHSKHFGPPAVGCEKIIKDAIASLWPQDAVAPIKTAHDAPQPMSPEASAAKIRLPKGFAIELIACEPLTHDPSCIAFDERGRLFVCELHGYNIEGHIDVTELNKTGVLDRKVRRIRWELQGGKIAEEAAKRQYGVVKMLTDTDGDGLMDKAKVWAEGLPPCYGVIPARGGIIVVCAPEIIFLADRNDDGNPEVRETLFRGFRTQVMERGVNNPRWGLDNWIYVGAGGTGGTIHGPHLAKPVELRHSDFRIKADGSAIEPVNGRVGTFGLTINDVGDRFPSTGGRPAMYALPLPYRYLARNPYVVTPDTNLSAATYNRGYRISQPHPWRVKRGRDPAWVKFYGGRETNSNFFSGGCSNTFYGDPLFPAEYRGNIFYCEPSLNIVHRCVVTRDGPGYKGQRATAEQESEFLASTDQWFRPMNLRVGPDGAIYIVDMYREIIEDYSAIPRFLQQQYGLDKGGNYGRIWRLAPESAVRRRPDDFSRFSAEQLARVAGDASLWRRLTAQRLLVRRNDTSAAETLTAHLRSKAAPQACIHALYTLDGLGRLRVSDVVRALKHKHHRVRIHALRLAERWLDENNALLKQVVSMTEDDGPGVRLQLAMSLGESNDVRVIEALLTLTREHGSEHWMAAAILSSSSNHAGTLLLGLLRQAVLTAGARTLLQPLAATVAGRRDGSAMSRTLATVPGLDEAAA
ncbi:MAG: PVC-type heme-binding CxxCH protein, partial [Pirellulales bacterium]